MTRNQLIVLGVIGLLAIGFVRILEQPDAPDDPLGMLFRSDSAHIDPMALAACAALQDPVRELFGGREGSVQIAPATNAPGGCVLEVQAPLIEDAASPESRLRAVFDMMGWRETEQGPGGSERSYHREPILCASSIETLSNQVSIVINCEIDEAVGSADS